MNISQPPKAKKSTTPRAQNDGSQILELTAVVGTGIVAVVVPFAPDARRCRRDRCIRLVPDFDSASSSGAVFGASANTTASRVTQHHFQLPPSMPLPLPLAQPPLNLLKMGIDCRAKRGRENRTGERGGSDNFIYASGFVRENVQRRRQVQSDSFRDLDDGLAREASLLSLTCAGGKIESRERRPR